MGLIITPLVVLLLWDEMPNLIENFQTKKEVAKQMIDLADTREPLYVEDVNGPTWNKERFTTGQKEGEFSHRVYPYSVVNGGVHSVQELQSAIWRDPVVAKHYSDFKLDRARVIEAEVNGDFHVSYRVGEEIFWTKKRLKVVKGERLITDGTHFTRTRCANMLSEAPPGKTLPDEPTPEVLDTPTLPPAGPTLFMPPVATGGDPPAPTLPSPGSVPFAPSVITGGGPAIPTSPSWDPAPLPPPVVIGGGPPGPADGSSDKNGAGGGDSPAPVPEPTTLLLLGSALIGLAGYGRKRLFGR